MVNQGTILACAPEVPDSVLAAMAALGAKTACVVGRPGAISNAAVVPLTQAGLTVVRQFQAATGCRRRA